MGIRRSHRNFRRAVSYAEGACPGNGRTHKIHRQAGGAGAGGRSNIESEVGATSYLQRVFDRRRRDGAAGLRQLRIARGLREARPAGHLGEGRDRDGVQRGSVMDFASSSPGDPLTPGIGATPGAKRLPLKEAKSLTKIPVLPISYGDAQPLLAALKGPMAPDEWRGSLPIPYHVGPGPARVHLKVQFNWDTKPVNDVIAKIPGSVAPDEWIIRGNHHDAWVNGAEDPVSGQAPLL